MTLRSQVIAALAVLLVALVAVLVVVGDAGVQTNVFSAVDTATPSPTPLPTATPVPVVSADNWELAEGQTDMWNYTADPSLDAQILIAKNQPISQVVASLGIDAPSEDTPLPSLVLVTEFANEFETQMTQQGADATFEGPGTQLIGGELAAIWRMKYSGADLDPSLPNGADLALVVMDLDDGNVTMLQYIVRTGPNDTVYADFEAWLAGNISSLITVDTADAPEDGTSPDADTGDTGDSTDDSGADTSTTTGDDTTADDPDASANDGDTGTSADDSAGDSGSDTGDTGASTGDSNTGGSGD